MNIEKSYACLHDIANTMEEHEAAAIYKAVLTVTRDGMFGNFTEGKRLTEQTRARCRDSVL